MERFNFVFLVAGFGFFGLAFLIMGWLPIAQYRDIEVVTIEQLSQDVPYQFEQLAATYPEAFLDAFGTVEATPDAFAEALRTGKASYIAEACWHCHSQQVRRIDPTDGTEVGHDISRWAGDTGLESVPDEYFNEMNYPHLFGTRRVGPDLMRSSGRHSNDWHLAHFYNPRHTTPYSVMPPYPWFFDDEEGLVPNKRGLSMVAYMQWLGSWHNQFAPTEYDNLPEVAFDPDWYPSQIPVDDGSDDEDEYEDDEYGDDGYGDEEEDY